MGSAEQSGLPCNCRYHNGLVLLPGIPIVFDYAYESGNDEETTGHPRSVDIILHGEDVRGVCTLNITNGFYDAYNDLSSTTLSVYCPIVDEQGLGVVLFYSQDRPPEELHSRVYRHHRPARYPFRDIDLLGFRPWPPVVCE